MTDNTHPDSEPDPAPLRGLTPATPSVEAMGILYDGQLATLRSLSERSFSTTIQALTLNLIAVAALIGGKTALTNHGQIIATGILVVFNAAVISYLVSKARAHHRERAKLSEIERPLRALAGLSAGSVAGNPSFWRSFAGGTALMAGTVLLAGVFATASFWVRLTAGEGPQEVNVTVKPAASLPK